jgi:uncharacterized glyoxalase superfamily protein PhnB
MTVAIKKLTPVLVVDSVEACLPFWCDRLGFTKTAEVPHEAANGETAIGFVILTHGGTELMLQSRASVRADVAVLGDDPAGTTLYLEVADLAPVRQAVQGLAPLFAERTTFYGAREIGVRDPAGNAVILSAFEPG